MACASLWFLPKSMGHISPKNACMSIKTQLWHRGGGEARARLLSSGLRFATELFCYEKLRKAHPLLAFVFSRDSRNLWGYLVVEIFFFLDDSLCVHKSV